MVIMMRFFPEYFLVVIPRGADAEGWKRGMSEWTNHEAFLDFLSEQVVDGLRVIRC